MNDHLTALAIVVLWPLYLALVAELFALVLLVRILKEEYCDGKERNRKPDEHHRQADKPTQPAQILKRGD